MLLNVLTKNKKKKTFNLASSFSKINSFLNDSFNLIFKMKNEPFYKRQRNKNEL